MEEKTFTIVLADGTEIKDLKINGNNYISKKKVDESVFEDNCAPMTIIDNDGAEMTFEHGEFIRQAHFSDGYYLAFREKSEEEIQMQTLQAQLEYLAMMTDVKF